MASGDDGVGGRGRWHRLRRTMGVGIGGRRWIEKAIKRGGDGSKVADGGCGYDLVVPPGDGPAAGVGRGPAASGVGTGEGDMKGFFCFFRLGGTEG
jgi:hypothetical protein